MHRKVNTFEFTCDRCSKVKIVHGIIFFGPDSLPKGWGTVKVHDCGMTGYTKTDELCGKCLEKNGARKLRTKNSA